LNDVDWNGVARFDTFHVRLEPLDQPYVARNSGGLKSLRSELFQPGAPVLVNTHEAEGRVGANGLLRHTKQARFSAVCLSALKGRYDCLVRAPKAGRMLANPKDIGIFPVHVDIF